MLFRNKKQIRRALMVLRGLRGLMLVSCSILNGTVFLSINSLDVDESEALLPVMSDALSIHVRE